MSLIPVGLTGPIRTKRFLGSGTDATAQTIYTFAGFDLGTPQLQRYIVVGIDARRTGNPSTISGVTIGGVTATINVVQKTGAANDAQSAMVCAHVPAGQTGDIVVTFSAGHTRCGIGVWAVYGLASATASGTAKTATDAADMALTVPADGFYFAHSRTSADATCTWTNATERYDEDVDTDLPHSGADGAYASSPVNVKADWSADSFTTSVCASYV